MTALIVLFCLFVLLAVLLLVAFGLLKMVIIPWILLREFFRSDWAPQSLKKAVGWTLGVAALLYVGYLSWSWYPREQPRPVAAAQPHWPPVRLTVQQPGLLPFPLGRGSIEHAHYNTTPKLIVSGDLVIEGRLRACFTASPDFKTPNETNTVQVSTEKGDTIQATGRSVYDPDNRTVSGSFQCVLSSGKQFSISFPPTSILQ